MRLSQPFVRRAGERGERRSAAASAAGSGRRGARGARGEAPGLAARLKGPEDNGRARRREPENRAERAAQPAVMGEASTGPRGRRDGVSEPAPPERARPNGSSGLA
ncbi:hypothetical protein D8O27_20235 [Burkholderia mallei]|uniref:Uncharacterized protein n=2 Tax=Burkholderia mallei TaxID=13373 RepID=A0AAX1X8E3_BURML|nr:hypothetical protein BMA2766 [Burkholderia mallei ATCC 23344]RKN95012.1 hypothetical protein D8O31_20765 [Burkholderia mallei]RKN97265.1 hypothetical protein D8O03_20330 [Burkholderia mallei]RKO01490.1 hypothetical protein D8O05_19310 [Burkholderia mallei]RKO10049.1 hypothetical protein D8O04_22910 [Burkholderia mallei]